MGAIPSTLGTAPAVLGYTALIVLWNRRPATGPHRRLYSVGRMVLTNYLTQTVLGVLALRYGPAEWMWRIATHHRRQRLRR